MRMSTLLCNPHSKPSGQRTEASHAAQASSCGNMRWKAIRLSGKRSMGRLLVIEQTRNKLSYNHA